MKKAAESPVRKPKDDTPGEGMKADREQGSGAPRARSIMAANMPAMQRSKFARQYRRGMAPSSLLRPSEQPELRRVALRLGEAEMPEGVAVSSRPRGVRWMKPCWIRNGSMISSIASRGSDSAAAMVSMPTGPPPKFCATMAR